MTPHFDCDRHFYYRSLSLLSQIVTTRDHTTLMRVSIEISANTYTRARYVYIRASVYNATRYMYCGLEHLASTLRKLRGLFAPHPAADSCVVLKHTRRKHRNDWRWPFPKQCLSKSLWVWSNGRDKEIRIDAMSLHLMFSKNKHTYVPNGWTNSLYTGSHLVFYTFFNRVNVNFSPLRIPVIFQSQIKQLFICWRIYSFLNL